MVENADLMKEGMTVEITYHAETETPLTVDASFHRIGDNLCRAKRTWQYGFFYRLKSSYS